MLCLHRRECLAVGRQTKKVAMVVGLYAATVSLDNVSVCGWRVCKQTNSESISMGGVSVKWQQWLDS